MKYSLEHILEAAKIESRGDWTGLLGYCQEWVKIESDNCLAWQGIGDSFRKLGQPEKAIAAYKRGLGNAPAAPVELLGRTISSAPIWFGLGHAFFDLGQLDNSIAALREATQIDPGEATLWNDLGVVCQALGDYRGANDAFEVAVRLSPLNKGFHNNQNALRSLISSQAGVLRGRQNASESAPQISNTSPEAKSPTPTVKERLAGQAAERAAEKEKVRAGAAKLAATLDAAARDIDVASTLEVILTNIEQGQSLRKAMIPVSWGWRDELKDVFVADVEREEMLGTSAPEAIRSALIKFSTR